jgi:hypothetical protein
MAVNVEIDKACAVLIVEQRRGWHQACEYVGVTIARSSIVVVVSRHLSNSSRRRDEHKVRCGVRE